VALVMGNLALGCSSEATPDWSSSGVAGQLSAAGVSSTSGGSATTGGAMNSDTAGSSGAGGASTALGGAGSAAGGTLASAGMSSAGTDPGGQASGGGSGGGGSGGGPAGKLKATMVVRGQGTATAGDEIMIGRVKAHGFAEVVVVSDAAVTAESVVGSQLVIISSSAESGPLQAKLKDIAIPVLCIEDAEFTKMGMAKAGDHTAGVSQVVIDAAGSALVGAATGTLTISSKPGELGWATPAAAALKGATLPGDPSRVVVFGYEKGAQMATLIAPERRAGFAIRETLAANLNADGLKLFDSILEWVIQ
jgi:hypothetical protein